MTKSELRKARKLAHSEGRKLDGELSLPRQETRNDTTSFSESYKGYRARERWARRYDDLNGAPESDYDR